MFGKTAFSAGQKKDETLIKENDLVQNIEEVAAFNMIVDTFEKVQAHSKSKSIEGIDSYGKRIADISDESHSAIQHTLLALANEADFGISIIEETREEMTRFHMLFQNSSISEAPGNQLAPLIDVLEKRKKEVGNAKKKNFSDTSTCQVLTK